MSERRERVAETVVAAFVRKLGATSCTARQLSIYSSGAG